MHLEKFLNGHKTSRYLTQCDIVIGRLPHQVDPYSGLAYNLFVCEQQIDRKFLKHINVYK